uniref:Uncharacterized protein n=1 Tax=Aegilops tauschii TaxID=37682 RepID=N1R3Y3_AEGTA
MPCACRSRPQTALLGARGRAAHRRRQDLQLQLEGFRLATPAETVLHRRNIFFQNDQHLFHWRCSLYKSAAEEQITEIHVLYLFAVVGWERIADGECEQWELLELPGLECSSSAARTRGVGAGVPEERAVRGHTAAAGHGGAAGVQVLGNGETERLHEGCLLPVHGQEHVHIYEMHSQIVDMRECLLPVVTEGLSHQQSSGGKRHKK